MDEDLGFIKINLDIFNTSLKSHNQEIPLYLINKSNDLQSNYNCFASNYDARSLWEKKKIIAMKKTKVRNRPHLISFDFTDETKCKKEFTSYLNKLTDLNKEIIYTKIKSFILNINEDISKLLFDILWNFIKLSSNNIYIEILYIFNIDYVNNYINFIWNKYNDNNEWLPSNEILNNDKLFDQDNYDSYCDYIKWKKSNLSICRAWCYIFKKENKMENIDTINNNILYYIDNNINGKHYIIDLLLDQVNILLDARPNNIILNKIINWDIANFENSTKFKIYNILEKYK